MSKQYYIAKAVENAHETDIFSIAVTPTSILSGSGASTLRVHSTATAEYAITQSIDVAHKLGCHHVVTAKGGLGHVACSAGFGGEIKIWRCSEAGDWELDATLKPSDLGESAATLAGEDGAAAAAAASGARARAVRGETGDAWALSLSKDEQYMAYTTHEGRIGVWDLKARARLLVYSTHNRATSSFAMAVDLSQDGRYTAAGYQDGSVHVFNNDQSKMVYSLPGLAKPVRAVVFSPLGKRLAAGGDAGVISLYDMKHGEPVGNLIPPRNVAETTTGATAASAAAASAAGGSGVWVMSLDFSASGEYLLAGYMDGKVRVWNTEQGTCVATNGETDMTALWSVKWLPPRSDRPGTDTESFCTAGSDRTLTIYREAGSQ